MDNERLSLWGAILEHDSNSGLLMVSGFFSERSNGGGICYEWSEERLLLLEGYTRW